MRPGGIFYTSSFGSFFGLSSSFGLARMFWLAGTAASGATRAFGTADKGLPRRCLPRCRGFRERTRADARKANKIHEISQEVRGSRGRARGAVGSFGSPSTPALSETKGENRQRTTFSIILSSAIVAETRSASASPSRLLSFHRKKPEALSFRSFARCRPIHNIFGDKPSEFPTRVRSEDPRIVHGSTRGLTSEEKASSRTSKFQLSILQSRCSFVLEIISISALTETSCNRYSLLFNMGIRNGCVSGNTWTCHSGNWTSRCFFLERDGVTAWG